MRHGTAILASLMMASGCGSGGGKVSPHSDGGGFDVQSDGGGAEVEETDAGTTACMRYAALAFINNGLDEIVAGPDGNYWVTETLTNRIAHTLPATKAPGMLKELDLPKAQSAPYNLVVGPDRNLWFTEKGPSGTRIARMTTAGVLDEFPFPAATSSRALVSGGFVPGAENRLWFIQTATFKLGSITTAGVLNQDESPLPNEPVALAAEPSGSILVVMRLASDTPDHLSDYKIMRRNPAGDVTMFPKTTTPLPGPVVEGADGTIWVGSLLEMHNTGSGAKATPAVVRVTGLGSNEEPKYETFALGFSYDALPNFVAGLFAGPDGDVFFSLNRDSGVGSATYAGRITKTGAIQFFSAQSFGTLAVDSDGNIWTTDLGAVICNKPVIVDVFPTPDGGGADGPDAAGDGSPSEASTGDSSAPTPDGAADASADVTLS